MQSIIIKYGDKTYDITDPVVLPYLIDTITLSDEQIKKDIEYIDRNNKIQVYQLTICVILNNINWVKKLIELKYDVREVHCQFAIENKDRKISFDIAKILIESYTKPNNININILANFFKNNQKPDD